MFNKIKKWFKNIEPASYFASIVIFLVISLGVSGVLHHNVNKAYKAQILELAKAHQEISIQVTDLKAANAKLHELNSALVTQLDTKAERVADVKTYITSNNKTICPDVAETIADTVVRMGDKYNVPTSAIVSVMEVESHFNFQAVGGVGERGLMQVRFNVWGEKLNIKSKYDLHGITIGIEKGVQVLDISLKECKYDLKRAFRQYNSGSTSRGSSIYVGNVMKSMGEYEAHTALRQVIKDQQKKEAGAVTIKVPVVHLDIIPHVDADKFPEVD